MRHNTGRCRSSSMDLLWLHVASEGVKWSHYEWLVDAPDVLVFTGISSIVGGFHLRWRHYWELDLKRLLGWVFWWGCVSVVSSYIKKKQTLLCFSSCSLLHCALFLAPSTRDSYYSFYWSTLSGRDSNKTWMSELNNTPGTIISE